jgi:glycerol-1-phosphate dehydrogenase [NAD(P)+]
MNGYLSKNASITIFGHKKTLPATLPLKVFCDLGILSSAPLELTKAGIGDSLCFYSCWFDWYLSHKILGTKFDKKPFEILQKKMDFLIKNYKKFSLKDEKFLKLLIEILLLSGQGMTHAGGSYPASQSEHLIAHCLDMKYGLKNILHGAQIAVTTFTSLKLQKKILQKKALKIKKVPGHFLQLREFFGTGVARECRAEYLKKVDGLLRHCEEHSDEAIHISEKIWTKHKTKLSKLLFDEKKLRQIFNHFKIDYDVESLGVSKQQYQECVANAKFIRNRFTCLDLT